MTDVVVIGGGINGLVAAIALARRKRSVVLVEQRATPGGAALTAEFAPGYRAPTLSHAIGPLDPDIARSLRLDRAGVEIITPDPALTALGRAGEMLTFHRDPVLTAASISQLSAADASRWPDFVATTQRLAAFAARIARQAPPSIDDRPAREGLRLLALGRRARRLGRGHLVRLARWAVMPIADLTAEWFQHEVLQAAIAAHAVFGHPAGPWSAGTGAMWLQRLAEDPMPVGGGVTVRGGPGALADALAKIAADAGVSVRLDTRVRQVMVTGGRAAGVVIDTGDEIPARTVVAAIDPKQLAIDLVPPSDLPPSYLERMRHVRARGVTAKINLALSEAPVFTSLHGDSVPLRGRLLIAPDIDYIERAFDATKYGEMSPSPWLEISMPSMFDASFAADGRHVLSIHVHYAPRHLRGLEWDANRDALFKSVMQVLGEHAPTLNALIVGREILTPEDLERRWGFPGGHIFHGEHALDQSWVARPLLGWAQYRTPIAGLYLASAGAHPGGGLTGLPGLLAARAVLATHR
jgi:phytoene dehydrogenase-like protein